MHLKSERLREIFKFYLAIYRPNVLYKCEQTNA